MIITANLANQIIDNGLMSVSWETPELDVDLSALSNKNIMIASGTFNQIMTLNKITKANNLWINDSLNVEQLLVLDKLRDQQVYIRSIHEYPLKRINVSGYIEPNTDIKMANILIKCCKKIHFKMTKEKNQTWNVIYKHWKCITDINIFNIWELEFLVRFIQKANKLISLSISNVDQNIINIIGESNIRFVKILYRPSSTFDVTPILSNPRIIAFKTNVNCIYDFDVRISYFGHKDKTNYNDIRQQCAINRKNNELERMIDIKTLC